MMGLILGVITFPVCALLAGFIVWLITRKTTVKDNVLVGDFTAAIVMCLSIAWGISKTDTARLYLDPQFRMQSELNAHPVYSAIHRFSPDESKSLHDFLIMRMERGITLPNAFLEARPLLTRMVNDRSGFADQKTTLIWGRVMLNSMQELQSQDPLLCYQAITPQKSDQQGFVESFSIENTEAFQQGIIKIYESADQGMRHDPRSDDEPPVEFNAAAREHAVLMKNISDRFGESVTKYMSAENLPAPSIELKKQICAAKIIKLEAIFKYPQAMASSLMHHELSWWGKRRQRSV